MQREELPIEDDFSGGCTWLEDEDEDVLLGCEDGQYQVLFKSTEQTAKHIIFHRLEEPVDSVAVEADVTLHSLPGSSADDYAFSGLVCVASPPGEPTRGYVFLLGADGVEERGFAIVRIDETNDDLRQEGYFQELVDESSDAVAGIGASNHVRGECRTTDAGVELTMFLNGKQVGAASDPDGFHPFDGLAFLVFGPNAGTDVRYDNFRADEIDEGDPD